MKAILLILATLLGGFLVVRGFIKNVREIKKKQAHTNTDKYLNYPLLVLWYAYLLIFCVGLTVNNLIVK